MFMITEQSSSPLSSTGVDVRWPVLHSHPHRQMIQNMEDPPLLESILLAKGTQTHRTVLTGTICTLRKKTALVTIATHNALKQRAMPWACIPNSQRRLRNSQSTTIQWRPLMEEDSQRHWQWNYAVPRFGLQWIFVCEINEQTFGCLIRTSNVSKRHI